MNSPNGSGSLVVICICLGLWVYQLKGDVKEANEFAKSMQYLSSDALMYLDAGQKNITVGACLSSSLLRNECVIREAAHIATGINNASFNFRRKHGDDTP